MTEVAPASFVDQLDERARREATNRDRGPTAAPIVEKRHDRGWVVRRVLVASDLGGLLTAFLLAEVVAATTPGGNFDLVAELVLFVATLPAWVLVARIYGLYSLDEQRTTHTTTDEWASVFNMVTVCTWLFFAFSWWSGVAHPQVEKLLLFWVFAALIVPLARTISRGLVRTTPAYVQNTVVVGAGDVGQTIVEKLLRHPEYGVNVVGFVDAEPKEQKETLRELTILGPPQELASIVERYRVERVIIAYSRAPHETTLALIRSLKDAFVQVDIVSRYFELVGPSTGISMIEGLPVLCLPPRGLGASSKLLKRAMDLTVSAAALLLLAPVWGLIALAIFLDSPGPIFFRQPRIGAGGREFGIFKFRTMVAEAEELKETVAHMSFHAARDARMFKIADDPRITRVGRLLRKTSVDELPQLINVLRGEMSLVGPRPLIPTEDAHVEDWGRDRLTLRPGMTGLWQVLGRSEIPFEEMVRLDYLYVTNWSLWHDVRLMCRTVPAMLSGGRGAY
ncbi:MAG TPA: sugar transferase [Gaiellaceae bacterium]|nr:sugar transferase [Gaiellaceae bacterium]